MKNENLKLSKLESMQMSNFLMKKELISYLDFKNKNPINKKKLTSFITNFIEDLFNIINQQILTFSQVQELTSKSQIEQLINNNKNISFTMILNFYDKTISDFNNLMTKNTFSRNISNKYINNKKITSLSDRYNNINKNLFEIEQNFFEQKYKTNFNSLNNNSKKNNISSYDIKSNIMILSSPNMSKNGSLKDLKLDYIDLNNLEKNKEKEEIQIFIKPKNIHGNNKIKNVNNKIILTKQIYKVCNSIPVSKKQFPKNAPERKNSFNKKIKFNKINIKKSKNNLKIVNLSNSDDNKK